MSTPNSRRAFLKQAGALSFTGAAGPLALNLAAIGEAAAAAANDYKALVCVFLYGGNDQSNTLVPYDHNSYDIYRSQRPSLATARDLLAGTVLNPMSALPGGRQYALAPQLTALLPAFQQREMAVMLNIGTLVRPFKDKQDYLDNSADRPPKLFSHNDQQATYQAGGVPGNTTGVGGRLGDEFVANSGNTTLTCIGVGGSGVFAAGTKTVAYQVSPQGAVPIKAIKGPLFGSAACQRAFQALITTPRGNLFEADFTRIVQRSIDTEATLSPELNQAAVATVFPEGNPLAAQLKMVARIISRRSSLLAGGHAGPKRQVFFVTLGGFDNHNELNAVHPLLLQTVGDAMAAFHNEMKAQQLGQQVTMFTASDFGRTLNADGDGSDHGWGSMHFVLGGAVNGGRYFGVPPQLANDGDDDVGRGRLLPRMAVDQFNGQLATWFGVPASAMPTVLPNLGNFAGDTLPLDFMKPASS